MLISFLLWFYPHLFLNHVFSHEKVDSEKYSDETSIAPTLIGIIGLYILVTAIADMSYHISFVYEGRKILGPQFELTHQNKAEIFATVVEIILGGVLIFGGNIFSRLISRLRLELKKDSL